MSFHIELGEADYSRSVFNLAALRNELPYESEVVVVKMHGSVIAEGEREWEGRRREREEKKGKVREREREWESAKVVVVSLSSFLSCRFLFVRAPGIEKSRSQPDVEVPYFAQVPITSLSLSILVS